jgi:hypothetical protein
MRSNRWLKLTRPADDCLEVSISARQAQFPRPLPEGDPVIIVLGEEDMGKPRYRDSRLWNVRSREVKADVSKPIAQVATRRLVICSRMMGRRPCCSKTSVRSRFSEPREFLLCKVAVVLFERGHTIADSNQHSREIGGVPCEKNSLLTVSSV